MSRDTRSGWEKGVEQRNAWSASPKITSMLEKEGIGTQYTYRQVKKFKELMAHGGYNVAQFPDYVRNQFLQEYPDKAFANETRGVKKEYAFKMSEKWRPTAKATKRHLQDWQVDLEYYKVLQRDFRWDQKDWGKACTETSWNEQFDAYVNSHWTNENNWQTIDPGDEKSPNEEDGQKAESSQAFDSRVKPQDLVTMGQTWNPSHESIEFAIKSHHISEEFVDDHIKEFRLKELSEKKTQSQWDNYWRRSLNKEWKKFKAKPHYAARKSADQPDFLNYRGNSDNSELDFLMIEMNSRWQPGEDAQRLMQSATDLDAQALAKRLKLFISKNLKLKKTQDQWERLLAKDLDLFKQYDDRWSQDADRRSTERKQRYEKNGPRKGSGLRHVRKKTAQLFDTQEKDITPQNSLIKKMDFLEEVGKGNLDAINQAKD